MADRMPTLEQQLAFLIKEEQLRPRALTIDQQLASFIEEQQGRSSLFPRSRTIPSDRLLTIEHELASLMEQQQGRQQSLQATNYVADRLPTIDQQLALLFEQQQGRRSVLQATSSLPGRVWTVEQQLALLTQDQQSGHAAFPAMGSLPETSTIQQQLVARLIQEQRVNQHFAATGAINPLSRPEEYNSSHSLSLEHLQLLAQLQRDTHLQQAQAGASSFDGLDYGRAVHPLSLGSHLGTRMPIPLTCGSHESSPGNRYRILVEAERQRSGPSLLQGVQAASSAMNADSSDESYLLAGSSRFLSLEHLQFMAQQHRHQMTLPDAYLPGQAGILHQAGGNSFDNRDSYLPTHTPSCTTSTGTTILLPPPLSRHGKSESFPVKLYRLMAHDTHIVSFTPDGKSFKIHDPDAFMKDVSSNYFHQSQFLSFVRQLNLYGFERILLGPNFGAYAHPSFIRGRPELLSNIKRKPNTAVGRAKSMKADAAKS